MVNKVIIGILVFLVVVSGGLGTYSYMLNRQINDLSEQLTSSQEEQAARIGVVSDELIVFKGETLDNFGVLREEVDGTITEISTLREEVDRINVVQDEIKDMATELSQSVINASKIYQMTSQSIVRITDGERTIGSGFVLDTKGHIVTAQHVVESLTEIEVILPDGSVSAATITGSCQFSDIAVLTLEGKTDTKPLKFADSATLPVGEPVVTIGNPFDLTETLTSGIVSQLNRFSEIEYDVQKRWVANLIQFDAAINSGSSGCPLLNSKGEVIGMVIARLNPDWGDGIYYAISSNKVKRVTTSIINQGSFDYPWIGVWITDLTSQIIQYRELDTINGALVKQISAGGPAEAAGIEVDDIIVAIDGKAMRNTADFISYLGEYKSPDEEATITLIRDKTRLELSLTIGKRSS